MVTAIRQTAVYFLTHPGELLRLKNLIKSTTAVFAVYLVISEVRASFAKEDPKDLATVIRKAFKSKNFQQLHTITLKATPDVTFWGRRVITVEGYTGVGWLFALGHYVYELSQKRFYDINETERSQGKEMGQKIIEFYETTSKDLLLRTRFTQWCCWWKELLADAPPPRCWYFKYCFIYYTKAQYIKAFGKEPTGGPHERHPDRWRDPNIKIS